MKNRFIGMIKSIGMTSAVNNFFDIRSSGVVVTTEWPGGTLTFYFFNYNGTSHLPFILNKSGQLATLNF